MFKTEHGKNLLIENDLKGFPTSRFLINRQSMTYDESIDYLYNSVPMFQNVGSAAYKEGLQTSIILDNHFGNPHTKFKTIHIGGTNGKGSCSHTIAAILQSAGYKVGLFTSPHLIDFRERIRINGEMISEEFISNFIENEKEFFAPLHPSFFELTTAMAFTYFAENNIDIAVIEVGLGGRLDCTNIITPILSVITNISFDHMQQLGDTLSKIAEEKAGIIKPNIPVVIGESTPDTHSVFENTALKNSSPIYWAEKSCEILSHSVEAGIGISYKTRKWGTIHSELGGEYQVLNTNTILTSVDLLIKSGLNISQKNILEGFKHVCSITGFAGRWQVINNTPLTICDTGHNKAGLEYIVKQIHNQKYNRLHIVFGMVNDKDIKSVLSIMPQNAIYYFCQAGVKRAMPSDNLQKIASKYNLKGNNYPNVSQAYCSAIENAETDDFIFIGGSSFIVADLLAFLTLSNK